MKRNFIFFLTGIAIIIQSCHKSGNPYLIPADQLREILVELHLADGYYAVNYSRFQNHNDSVNFYHQIFRSYGYNEKMFDSTLHYYSANPMDFEPIYEKVVDELNKYEEQINELRTAEADSSRNLYTGKKIWHIPADGPTRRIFFDIPISDDSSTYKILTAVRVYPDDQSKNLRLTAYFWYVDSTGKGHRENFPEVKYSRMHRMGVYTTTKVPDDRKATHIRGWILNDSHQNTHYRKHADVFTIYISKSYLPHEQKNNRPLPLPRKR